MWSIQTFTTHPSLPRSLADLRTSPLVLQRNGGFGDVTVGQEFLSPSSNQKGVFLPRTEGSGNPPDTQGIKRIFSLRGMWSYQNANASISQVKFRTTVKSGITSMANLTSAGNTGICSKIPQLPTFFSRCGTRRSHPHQASPSRYTAQRPPRGETPARTSGAAEGSPGILIAVGEGKWSPLLCGLSDAERRDSPSSP